MRLLPLVAISGLLLSPLPGQGTKDDYERAFSLKPRIFTTVFPPDTIAAGSSAVIAADSFFGSSALTTTHD